MHQDKIEIGSQLKTAILIVLKINEISLIICYIMPGKIADIPV